MTLLLPQHLRHFMHLFDNLGEMQAYYVHVIFDLGCQRLAFVFSDAPLELKAANFLFLSENVHLLAFDVGDYHLYCSGQINIGK